MTNETRVVPVDLLPCPFCGGEPYFTHDHYVHDDLTPMPCVECRSCSSHLKYEDWNRRAQPAAPVTTQEPVKLPDRKGTHLHYDTLMPTFSKGWNACLDEIAKLGPLYTQADADEVERLRAPLHELATTLHKRYFAKDSPVFEPFDFASGLIGQIDNMVAGLLQDISRVRTQLAERDSLLRYIGADLAEALYTNIQGVAEQVIGQIDAALSASAEPGAPVELDPCPSCGVPGYTGSCDKCIPY